MFFLFVPFVTGGIHIRVRAAGGQSRPSCALAHLRLGDGHLSGLSGLLLLAAGARGERVRFQPDTFDQSGHVHQHVLARFRTRTGSDDGRAVQPRRKGPGTGNRMRDRITAGIRRDQDVPKPVGLV